MDVCGLVGWQAGRQSGAVPEAINEVVDDDEQLDRIASRFLPSGLAWARKRRLEESCASSDGMSCIEHPMVVD